MTADDAWYLIMFWWGGLCAWAFISGFQNIRFIILPVGLAFAFSNPHDAMADTVSPQSNGYYKAGSTPTYGSTPASVCTCGIAGGGSACYSTYTWCPQGNQSSVSCNEYASSGGCGVGSVLGSYGITVVTQPVCPSANPAYTYNATTNTCNRTNDQPYYDASAACATAGGSSTGQVDAGNAADQAIAKGVSTANAVYAGQAACLGSISGLLDGLSTNIGVIAGQAVQSGMTPTNALAWANSFGSEALKEQQISQTVGGSAWTVFQSGAAGAVLLAAAAVLAAPVAAPIAVSFLGTGAIFSAALALTSWPGVTSTEQTAGINAAVTAIQSGATPIQAMIVSTSVAQTTPSTSTTAQQNDAAIAAMTTALNQSASTWSAPTASNNPMNPVFYASNQGSNSSTLPNFNTNSTISNNSVLAAATDSYTLSSAGFSDSVIQAGGIEGGTLAAAGGAASSVQAGSLAYAQCDASGGSQSGCVVSAQNASNAYQAGQTTQQAITTGQTAQNAADAAAAAVQAHNDAQGIEGAINGTTAAVNSAANQISTAANLCALHPSALACLAVNQSTVNDPSDISGQMPDFGNTFTNLLGWSVPAHTSTCPTLTLDLSGVGLGVHTMDAQCTIIEQISSIISSAMTVVWTIVAMFIVLEA